MTDSDWRLDLERVVEQNLGELIRETKEYDYAIKRAKDKSKAQIWVALAILNHKINQQNVMKKGYESKIPRDELTKILETLEKL